MALPAPAHAQERSYPVKPARFVISTTAGSGGEAFARAVAEQLGKRLNQTVIVDPRPGAGGNLAAEIVANAAPDGYTLLLGSVASLAIAVSYYKNLSYDVRRDFAPISNVGQTAIGLFASPGVAANNLAALTAMIRAAPAGAFSCASAGVGGLLHLTCEMYQKAAGVKLLHVPYKGTAFFLPDLLAGQVTVAFDTVPVYLGHVKAGKVKVLAVTTPKRTPVFPEVPTAEEAGFPGLVAMALYGLFAPVRTSSDIVQLLSREIVPVLQDTTLRERLLTQAIEAEASSPAGLRDLLQSEIAKWARVIKESDIRPE
jgi:tripartite-type tricarboxylate transporter receptor subunit TctC